MRPGDVIDGKYELVEPLGESGMGMVFKARTRATGEWVTVKVVYAHLAINQKSIDRYLREARAANDIGSEYIAWVIAVGQAETGELYVVREHLEGHDLAQLLELGGPMRPDRAVALVQQAANGLDLAHQRGIAHWDIKPQNIVVTRDEAGRELVHIVDFGVARFRDAVGNDAAQATVSGAALGIGYYMPPEQVRGSADRDHRIDVYALGVVLYELLTGRRPYDAETHSQVLDLIATTDPTPLAALRPGLSHRLAKVVERAMAKDPNARYLSMTDFCHALSGLTDEELRPPEPERSPSGPGKPATASELVTTRPDLPSSVIDRRRAAGETRARTSSEPPLPRASAAPRSRAWIWVVVLVLVVCALAAVAVIVAARSCRPVAPDRGAATSAAVPQPETSGLHPDDRDFVDDRGGMGWSDRCFYHLTAERWDAAHAACERGLEIATEPEVRSSLYYNLGRIAQGQGDTEAARQGYMKSLELRPDNPAVRSRLESLGAP
jgi:serine/threonine-protein kinase